jgi:hypothetical protein
MGLVPATGRAEEPAQVRRTVVLAQPLNLFSGQFGASVEHALSEHVALAATLQAGVSAEKNGFVPTWDITTRHFGGRLEPGVHFYLAGRAPEGFWVGPHLEVSVLQHNTVDELVTPEGSRTSKSRMRTLSYGGGAWVGYTAILSPGFSAQVGVGLVALARDTVFSSDNTLGTIPGGLDQSNTDGWWVGPRMSAGLGWAF